MALTAQQLFEKSGAFLNGHFLLTSGLHSPVYWEKFQVLQYPEYTQQLCGMIARHFRDQNIQVVAGPTTGGVILAYDVGRQLGVRGIFAEKVDGSTARAFRRGFIHSHLAADQPLPGGGTSRLASAASIFHALSSITDMILKLSTLSLLLGVVLVLPQIYGIAKPAAFAACSNSALVFVAYHIKKAASSFENLKQFLNAGISNKFISVLSFSLSFIILPCFSLSYSTP